MKTSSVVTALFVTLAACESATGPTMSTLQNDDYVSGAVSFQGAMNSGEGGAVVLGPQSSAFTLRKVDFLFGGADTSEAITLTIYADAGTDNPGIVLYSHDYTLTPSDAAFQQVDLTAQNIVVDAGQKIRVAVLLQHDNLPSIAIDGNGITSGRNFIYSAGWSKAETAGLPGDWIIRAEIATN